VIVVERPGPMATVQDLGRTGLAHLGVGRSGAADRPSLRLANRLVGNPESAAGLEATLGGVVLRFERAATVALAGAPCPIRVDDRAYAMNAPLDVPAGGVLSLGTPAQGLRTYLAVRGGLDVPPVLGSRSTDLLSGLGPAVLTDGTTLPIGDPQGAYAGVDVAPVALASGVVRLRVLPGPREAWFEADALTRLTSTAYRVTPASDRVGLRLSGPVLSRRITDELASEGMVEGALQVPPDGQPVLFLADHPVTGGYPVIAVVDVADIPLAAQVRPGESLRFTLGARPGR